MLHTISIHLHYYVESSLKVFVFTNNLCHYVVVEVCIQYSLSLLCGVVSEKIVLKTYNIAQRFTHRQSYGSSVSSKC